MSAYVFCGISINISSHTVSHRAWPHVIPLCAEGNHEVPKCHLKLKGAGTMYVTIIRRFSGNYLVVSEESTIFAPVI